MYSGECSIPTNQQYNDETSLTPMQEDLRHKEQRICSLRDLGDHKHRYSNALENVRIYCMKSEACPTKGRIAPPKTCKLDEGEEGIMRARDF